MPTEPIRIQLPAPYPEDADARGALDVCRRLREQGFVSWLAGGCVRDLLRGVAVKDYDIASQAAPADVQRIFRRTVAVGEAFGVVRVMGDGASPPMWEVAQFRAEFGYADGRHPDAVRPGTPAEDAARRDFTINGLFLDPVGMVVLDHVGGLADLDAGLIRAIGDAATRFGEDFLRMLRAVRFVARTGFALDPDTAVALQSMAGRIVEVSGERITDELRGTLGSTGVERGLELLESLELAEHLFPGLAPGPGDLEDMQAVVVQGAACGRAHPGEWLPALVPLIDGDGTAPRELARVEEAVHSRLRLSRQERSELRDLLECRRALARAPSTVAADKRLCRRPGFARALTLLGADPHAGAAEHAATWRERTASWTDADLHPPVLLTGRDLIAAGHPHGPELGAILRALEDAQLEGEVTDLESARAWLRSRR